MKEVDDGWWGVKSEEVGEGKGQTLKNKSIIACVIKS